MVTIENDWLKAVINPKGAELTSLQLTATGAEYMWSGDTTVWAKHSPVLFPIVGTLKNNSVVINGHQYQMSRHGFARDMNFDVEHHSSADAIFILRDSPETKKLYPFAFEFRIKYSLESNQLSVTYLVKNTDTQTMYFSVGGHPAFRLPLQQNIDYSDYYLLFNEVEYAGRWPISPDGLITKTPEEMFRESQKLVLSRQLFYKDALVFKHLRSDRLRLQSDKGGPALEFEFRGFPFLGLWAAKNADFLCIEPWCGIADNVDASGLIEQKEGIERLGAGEEFTRTWSVTLF
jgi:galactose mutarotase-like enzyme